MAAWTTWPSATSADPRSASTLKSKSWPTPAFRRSDPSTFAAPPTKSLTPRPPRPRPRLVRLARRRQAVRVDRVGAQELRPLAREEAGVLEEIEARELFPDEHGRPDRRRRRGGDRVLDLLLVRSHVGFVVDRLVIVGGRRGARAARVLLHLRPDLPLVGLLHHLLPAAPPPHHILAREG